MLTLSQGNLKSWDFFLFSCISSSPPFSLEQDFGSMDKRLKVYVSYSGLVVVCQTINKRFEILCLYPISPCPLGFLSLVIFFQDL